MRASELSQVRKKNGEKAPCSIAPAMSFASCEPGRSAQPRSKLRSRASPRSNTDDGDDFRLLFVSTGVSMNISRLLGLLCLAAACSVALALPLQTNALPVAHASAASPRPMQVKRLPTPVQPPTPGCYKRMTVGEVTLCSNEFNFNFKTGDLQFPQPLHGRTSDGTYRADRGYGNLHSQIINLIGHVVVHRDATKDKAGKPVEALTLTAAQTHIESKAKFYRASGNVK